MVINASIEILFLTNSLMRGDMGSNPIADII